MTKFKYWVLSIVCAICCTQQSDAQTITVLTTDGESKTITNVDSIQLFDSNTVNLVMLKADYSSLKFQVGAPQYVDWVYVVLPTDRYASLKREKGYTDADFFSKGAHQVGTQIIEINDGDALPHPAEWWDGNYSVKPGTAYCVLVAKAQKTFQWNNGKGATIWKPIEKYGNSYPSNPDDQQGNVSYVPDYTDGIRLGNYYTKSLDADVTYEGFFYQQYFWTAAPSIVEDAPTVNILQNSANEIRYTVTPPSKARSCKVLFISDKEYVKLLDAVGEYGLNACVLANGQSVTANAEICASSLSIGGNYHILTAATFDELGTIQSYAHQAVTTENRAPITVLYTINATASEVSVDNNRNESIADPFNVPSFTRVKANALRLFKFETLFPTLSPGTYKVSAILVPTAYHTLLKDELVNADGTPYVEQLKFSSTFYANEQRVAKTPSKISAPNDRVEQIVLFDKLEITSDDTTATYSLEFEVASTDVGTSTNPKCEAINIYKIIIEACDPSDETN